MIISEIGNKEIIKTSRYLKNKISITINVFILYKLIITRIPKGLLPLVTCIGISQGNESDFNYLFNQMKATNDTDLRANIIASLACTKDPILQLSLLDFQLKANTSDIFDALIIVTNRPVGFVTSWNYLKRNWDYLYSKYLNN